MPEPLYPGAQLSIFGLKLSILRQDRLSAPRFSLSLAPSSLSWRRSLYPGVELPIPARSASASLPGPYRGARRFVGWDRLRVRTEEVAQGLEYPRQELSEQGGVGLAALTLFLEAR